MKKKLFVFLPILSLILCFSASSFAAVSWTSTGGPFGTRAGEIIDVEINRSAPQNIYVLWKDYDILLSKFVYSILKTTDNGETWTQIRPATPYPFREYDDTIPGLIYFDLLGINADPTNFNRVFVYGNNQATDPTRGGVWLSDNGGENWAKKYGGTIGTTTRIFEIAPSNPNYLYRANSVANLNQIPSASRKRIMSVSTDGGDSWTDLSTPEGLPEDGGINAMAIHPTNESIVAVSCIYPMTWSYNHGLGGIYISRNAGVSFELEYNDVPAGYHNSPGDVPGWISEIAFNPSAPSNIRAIKKGGTFYALPTNRYVSAEVINSTDGGYTWSSFEVEEMYPIEPIFGGRPETKTHMVVDPGNFNRMLYKYSYPWRTQDGGVSWLKLTPGFDFKVDAEYSSAESGTIWVADWNGAVNSLRKSKDWGSNWTDKTQQLLAVPQANSVFVNPYVRGTIFANASTLYRSLDYGNTWAAIQDIYGPTFSVTTREAFVVSSDMISIFRTTNNLGTWSTQYTLSSTTEQIYVLKCSPRDAGVLFATIRNWQNGSLCRFVKSTDSALSWSSAIGPTGTVEMPGILEISQSSPEVMYKTCWYKVGVFKTSDEGQTWADISNGVTGVLTPSAIAIDPTDPDTVYVGSLGNNSAGPVYVSTTEAPSWRSLGNNPLDPANSYCIKILVNPVRPNRVYGLFVHRTTGATVLGKRLYTQSQGWTNIGTGLSGNPIADFDIDRKTDAVLYVATENGVYRGIDMEEVLPPTIEAVSPSSPVNLSSTNLRIDGNYFIYPYVNRVYIQKGSYTRDLSFSVVDYIRINAVLPYGLDIGTYEVKVVADYPSPTGTLTSYPFSIEVVGASPDGPTIEAVKFDGRTYLGPADPVSRSPSVRARIRDWQLISAEGFEYILNSVSDPGFSKRVTLESSVFTPSGIDTTEGEINFLVTPSIAPGAYDFVIVAKDQATSEAYPEGNVGAWTGRINVDVGSLSVIGNVMSYPHPYRPVKGVGADKTLTIAYNLTRDAAVTVYVYDISGKLVLTRKFASGVQGGHAGYNQFQWNGRTDLGNIVGNGMYVIKVVSGNKSLKSGKIVVLD